MFNLLKNHFFIYQNHLEKKIKTLITSLLILTIFFLQPTMVFAANKNIENLQTQNIIKINQEQINQDIFKMSAKRNYTETKINSTSNYPDFLWIASLIIPGGGHMLMGEIGAGLAFMAISAIFIYAYLYFDKINNSSGQNFAIFFTYLLAALCIAALLTVHSVNIITAYIINRAKIKEYEEEIKVLKNIIENTKISDNSILYKAFSF